MPVYDVNDVRESKILTNISLGFKNPAFITDRLANIIAVNKQSDRYRVSKPESWVMEPGSDIRSPGAEANEIPGLTLSEDTYYCVDHSLEMSVTDEEQQEAEVVTPFKDATVHTTEKVWLGRELSLSGLVTNTANYAPGHSTTLVGTQQWTDLANSDPLANIQAAIQAVHAKLFVRPNTMMIPWRVMWSLKEHPQFIERIKYSERGIVTPEILQAFFEIPNIIVPEAGYNSANMGQAPTVDYLWNNDVVIAHVPQRVNQGMPAFVGEFVWKHPNGSTQLVDGWREEWRKCDMVRVSRRYDHKFLSVDENGLSTAGYIIKDVIA